MTGEKMANLSIKVVPGARKDRVVGCYGDAIKVQASSPPEKGRANEAVIELIARELRVSAAQVRIVRGHSQPRKVIEVQGISQEATLELLAQSSAQ